MTNRSWFTARAIDADEAEIAIYDEIGLFGVTAKDFRDELKALGPVAHINVHINSPGGNVFDGLTIHNLLARHKASVTVTIDGIAASIASVIAMAGDAVVMPENAMIMIHDPAGVVVGTSKEMRDLAAALDKAKLSLISAYANKSGMERDQIAELMSAETWLTAEEAVEFGFADSIEAPVKMAASFDLSKFKNAPAAMTPPDAKAADAAPTCQEKDIPMTDTPETGAATDEAAVTATPETQPETKTEPAAGTETSAQIEARVRKDTADIMAACALVGKPEKASEFIAKSISLSEVVAALQTERATASEDKTVSARKPQTDKAPAVIDTMAIYAKWNGRAA